MRRVAQGRGWTGMFVLALLASFSPAVCGQQLAHPGWRGNAVAAEPWWNHAVFVRYRSDADFPTVSSGLTGMGEVGADSVLLPDLVSDAAQMGTARPFADRFGTEDDLDALLHEVSVRRMHLLVRIPLQRAAASPGELRYWMSRGAAGVDVGNVNDADAERLTLVRKALGQYPGSRVVLAHRQGASPQPDNFTQRGQRAGMQAAVPHSLAIVLPVIEPDQVEGESRGAATLPLLEVPAPDGVAAALASGPAASLPQSVTGLRSLVPVLLSPATPILDAALLKTEADRAALQTVLAFRSTHPLWCSGATKLLTGTSAGLRAWVLQRSRHGAAAPALLLIENNGPDTATLHLRDAVLHAGVRGSYLRPLLRSDGAMGAVDLEAGSLPAGAALLAEIR